LSLELVGLVLKNVFFKSLKNKSFSGNDLGVRVRFSFPIYKETKPNPEQTNNNGGCYAPPVVGWCSVPKLKTNPKTKPKTKPLSGTKEE
jgi:hypothetical protein